MGKELVINILLIDDFYKIMRFEKVLDEKHFLGNDDLGTESFEHALGGLEILVDKHKAIFRSWEFDELTDVVICLVKSLVLLKVLTTNNFFGRFSTENEFMHIQMENEQVLILRLGNDEDTLLLSFLRTDNLPRQSRNNPYFKDFPVNKQEWIEQSIIAIEEYLVVIKNNIELAQNSFWMGFLSEWDRIIGERVK